MKPIKVLWQSHLRKAQSTMVIFAIVLTSGLNAQDLIYRLSPVPSGQQVRYEQLGRGKITNNTPETLRVSFHIVAAEARRGLVFETHTAEAIVPPGIKAMRLQKLTWISPRYLTGYEQFLRTGLIPEGSYTLSVTMHGYAKGGDTIHFEVRQPRQIRLLTPRDGDSVTDPSMLRFSWTPHGREGYRVILWKALPGEERDQAITKFPYAVLHTMQPSTAYPLDAPLLNPGMTYCWMVTTGNALSSIGWFTVGAALAGNLPFEMALPWTSAPVLVFPSRLGGDSAVVYAKGRLVFLFEATNHPKIAKMTLRNFEAVIRPFNLLIDINGDGKKDSFHVGGVFLGPEHVDMNASTGTIDLETGQCSFSLKIISPPKALVQGARVSDFFPVPVTITESGRIDIMGRKLATAGKFTIETGLLAGTIVCGIQEREPEPCGTRQPDWTCPGCSRRNGGGRGACPSCGELSPPWNCPKCGCAQPAGTTVCRCRH